MRFEILGPIRVNIDVHEVAITAGRERTLLAMLLLHANNPVTTEKLVDAIWDTSAPQTARNQLQRCVHQLRRRIGDLGSTVIVTEPTGYRAAVDSNELDLFQFRQLVAEARAMANSGRPAEAATTYRAALDLWRGPALADIDSPPVREAAALLDQEYAQALEERLDVELAAGGAGELVTEVAALVQQHPYREGLHGALMLALYRAGRQAEALAAYRRARRLLHDELGTEPGSKLQRLHRAILARDPTLDVPPPGQPGPTPPKPRELPGDVSGFTGRVDALETLDEHLPDGEDPTGPVIISAIAGTAGVGKTALAVRWAHRVADRFPDGQLYLNLRGYATGSPLPPIEALSMLLRSLGLPSDQIPVEEPEASARYRTLLADRRVLVVLDNARSVTQVRPLLPGSPGCLALVTSRDRLAGLVARDGTHRLTLDVLDADDAHDLLAHLLGVAGVRAEPEATAELARACGYLPLALRIAAANLTDHPDRSIAAYVEDLVEGRRLDALAVAGDEENAVRAAFDLSYRTIPEPAQRMFRLLGLVPGPDITPPAAAALADIPPAEASRVLDRLAAAHLIGEQAPGRFAFHDLLRWFAQDRSERQDSSHERAASLDRLFGWYFFAADAASRLAYPTVARLPLPELLAPPRAPIPPYADRTSALAFLDAERANLLAALTHAAAHGPQRSIAWRLVDALRVYLWSGRHTLDGLSAGRACMKAALAEEDLSGQAVAQLTLAMIRESHGEYGEAHIHGTQACDLAVDAHWPEGEAAANNQVAGVCRLDGRLEEAIRHQSRALSINQKLGRYGAQGTNLATLGTIHLELGDLARAVSCHVKALAISRDTGNRHLEATELANVGSSYHMIGRLDEALEHLDEGLAIAVELGDPVVESAILSNTAHVHHDAGRSRDALDLIAVSIAAAAKDDRRAEEYVLHIKAKIHNRLGKHDLALAYGDRMLALARESASPHNEAEALIDLATATRCLGRHDEALEDVQSATELARRLGYKVHEGRALTVLAEIELDEETLGKAEGTAQAALANHRHTGYRLGEAETLALLGRIAHATGDPRAAQERWRAAHDVFTEIGAAVPADLACETQRS